jgi:hypothetical protein
MSRSSFHAGIVLGALAATPGLVAGCSGGDVSHSGNTTSNVTGGGNGLGGGDGLGQGGATFAGTGGGAPACAGLQCAQVACDGTAKTTVSGTVYDPAGKVPLYNVIVYVPNAELAPIPDGVSCDQCDSSLSGAPIVTALTDTRGRFVLNDVPVGENIPLVIQIGKWRREIVLPKVEACVDNPTEDRSVRLPRNQAEGHLPRIALTTGNADPLECLLRKVGIDDAEFTAEDGQGRVNLYVGRGGTSEFDPDLNDGAELTSATTLWSTQESLMRYDVLLLACEGDQDRSNKRAEARQALFDYASAGGRVFMSHWHNYWLEEGPDPFPQTASWNHQNDPRDDPFTARIDTSFPKGAALSEWLFNVGASTTAGELVIEAAQHTVDDVNPGTSTRWIYSEEPITPGVQYFTFNTPLGAAEDAKCGRVVYSDIHVSSSDETDRPVPQGCQTTDLSPQEKALLYMLFDLSACVTPDDQPPPIPSENPR